MATEKKGRKKNSSLPVFPPFSIFDDRDLVDDEIRVETN